ncbi:MAG: hypothetical protein HC914_07355 [Chloroflexaceae bacterium]|nr:hypothetical protein [Chloroflexaceae bacterium]
MAETVPTILLPVLLARLVELLLRYDEAGFRRLFVAHPGTPAEDATLRPVRDLAALLYLRDELFEHILPRIVRRLSFSIPNQIHIEEPPTTGDINWERTLAATWEERPGETPLHLHTRRAGATLPRLPTCSPWQRCWRCKPPPIACCKANC